ncbi:MAG: DUF58 domain-containing protein [Chloroflexota bacterium]|nr:DUF58 domain-containing protein [Chloroflexota bacterium]
MNRIRFFLRGPLWIPLPSGALHITVRHWALVIAWFIVTGFAYQTGRDIFFRFSYLLLGVEVFSFLWAAYSVATFRLERHLITPRTQVGRVAEERFLVHNTGRFAKIWIEIRDESELKSHRVSRVLNALAAGVRWSWSARTLCRRRGRFRLGPITVAGGDPFGLFVFQRRLPNTTTAITIHPATVDLPTFATPMGQLPGGDTLRRRTHHTTTNVAGTREYAPGDSFNRIHWRSTARMERLIVKEFELDPAADVWVFLDMERSVQAGQWQEDAWDQRDLAQLWFGERRAMRLPPNTEEYVVAIAASVAKYFLRQQRAVGFVGYGHQHEIVQPDRGERQLNRLLEVLAVLRAEGGIRFGHVLGVEAARLGRNNTLVAVTPSAETSWVKSLRETKRRGLRTIAVIADPNTFGGHGDTAGAAAELEASGIPTYVVREGDDLQAVLAR